MLNELIIGVVKGIRTVESWVMCRGSHRYSDHIPIAGYPLQVRSCTRCGYREDGSGYNK